MSLMNNVSEDLSIGLLQYNINTTDPLKNIETINRFISNNKSDIVILPEMGITGFLLKHLEHFLKNMNNYISILSDISKKNQVILCTTLPFQENKYIYNRLFFFNPDGNIYWYDKHYLINWGGFNEGKYFTNGNSFLVLNLSGWIIGFAICYDIRFPELFYKMNLYAIEKYRDYIKLFIIPAQWPDKRIEHFILLSKARAIENQAYVACTNNIGTVGELNFNGRSILVHPDGRELLLLDGQEGLFINKISLKEVQTIQKERPILMDRYKINILT